MNKLITRKLTTVANLEKLFQFTFINICPITANANSRMNQSELEANQTGAKRGKMHVRQFIAPDWLKKQRVCSDWLKRVARHF